MTFFHFKAIQTLKTRYRQRGAIVAHSKARKKASRPIYVQVNTRCVSEGETQKLTKPDL
jgi:hypothetical protein